MGLVTRIGNAILGLVSRSAVRPATAWTASYSDPLAEMPMLQEQIKTYAAAGNLRLRHTQVMDNFSGETSEMRAAYRRAFLAEPTIKSALLGKISSVQTMPLQVMPASESRLDKEVAEFIKWTLTTCKGGVPELVWDIATGGLVDGWSICEKLYYEVQRGKYAGKIGLERVKAKDTYYIQLEVDPYRNITGVFPFQGNAGSKFDPGDFVIFNYLSLFESPTGVSDLRASYRAAEMIPAILKLRMIFLDKYIGPFLKGSVSDVQLRQQMQTELAKARQGGFIVTDPGTDIEMINLATSGTADFQSALEDMRQEVAVGISGAFLHMMTGMNPGARGDSAVQQDTVDLFIWLLSAKISECIQSQIVPDLVNWNYGSTVDYPIVSLGKESMEDVNAAIEVFGGVQSLGLPLSRKEVYERTRVSPPVDEQDALQPPGAGGMGGPDGGIPGQPAPMGNPNDPNADPMGGDQPPALPIGGNDLDTDNSGSMDYDKSLALFDAMLQASIRAQQGDTSAQDELDALAEIAGNPNLVELSQFAESAWVSAGKSKSGKNKWKNTATGRIRYQENKPGEKRERQQKSHAAVQQLVQKNYEYINSGGTTEPLSAEEWADLAEQLPNLKVDQLRGVRNALMLKVKDQKRHADWVAELQRQAKEIASGTGGDTEPQQPQGVATGVNQPQSDGVEAAPAESVPQGQAAKEPHEMTREQYLPTHTTGGLNPTTVAKARQQLENSRKNTPHNAGDDEKRLNSLESSASEYHKTAVEMALAGGKTVPPEVLADYPDLAEKYGPKQDGQGFTGTDAQGREWRNGELVAKVEEPTAPEPQADDEPLDFGMDAMYPTVDKSKLAEKPAPDQNSNRHSTEEEVKKSLQDVQNKRGKRYAEKLQSQWVRLRPKDGHILLHEYRAGGYVTRSDDGKYTFHMIADTDEKNWRIADTVDVTDQYADKPAPSANAEGQIYTAKDVRQQQHIIDSLKDRGADQAQIDRAYDRLEHMNRNRSDVEKGEGEASKGEGKPKEPHEMSRDQFNKDLIERDGLQGARDPQGAIDSMIQGAESEIEKANRFLAKAKTPEEKKKIQDTITWHKERLANISHKHNIEQALQQGKPVPPEVLADYPDLQAKYGQASPQPTEAPADKPAPKPKRPRKPAAKKAKEQLEAKKPSGHSEAARERLTPEDFGGDDAHNKAESIRNARKQEYQDWLKQNPPREKSPQERQTEQAKVKSAVLESAKKSPVGRVDFQEVYDSLGEHMNKADFKEYLSDLHKKGEIRLSGFNMEKSLLTDTDLAFSTGIDSPPPSADWSEHVKNYNGKTMWMAGPAE